jgi:hypothetical protein
MCLTVKCNPARIEFHADRDAAEGLACHEPAHIMPTLVRHGHRECKGGANERA